MIFAVYLKSSLMQNMFLHLLENVTIFLLPIKIILWLFFQPIPSGKNIVTGVKTFLSRGLTSPRAKTKEVSTNIIHFTLFSYHCKF